MYSVVVYFNHDYMIEVFVLNNEEISLDDTSGDLHIVDLSFHTQHNWVYVEVELNYPNIILKKDLELEDMSFYLYTDPEYGKVLTKAKPVNKKYDLVTLVPSW